MFSELKARSREEGFTLIELLVVMIIISILMAIAIPTFLGQKENAKATSAKANIKSVQDSIESCAASDPNGSYIPCATTEAVGVQEPGLKQTFTGCTVANASSCITNVGGGSQEGYTITATAATSTPTLFTLTKSIKGVKKTCTPVGKTCKAPSGTDVNQW